MNHLTNKNTLNWACYDFNLGPDDLRYLLDDGSLFLGYRKNVNFSQSTHVHNGYEVLLVLSGERQMFVEKKTCIMKKYDLILIPPQTLHKSTRYVTGSEIYSFYYTVPPELASLLTREPHQYKLDPVRFEQIKKLFERMAREFRNKEKGYSVLLASLAEEILVSLIRFPGTHQPGSVTEGSEVNRKMMAIADYINTEYAENLTLKSLSERFYISSSYLSRSFHRETGFSLIEYINNTRVLESKKALLASDDSISEICSRCGFGSMTNFGRIFKSLTGVSPRTYRKTGLIHSTDSHFQ